MLRSKRFLIIGILALSIALIGGAPGTQSKVPSEAEASTQVASGFRTRNDLLADVGTIEPNFGGMFLDPTENVLYIYLLDPSKKDSAVAALARVFGQIHPPGSVPPAYVRVLQAQYSIAQLKQWYDSMRMELFTIPGVAVTDLSEGKNRLWVGIEDVRLQAKVEEELKRLGIPIQAVIIEQFGPVVPATHTVRDAVRPVDGGVLITNGNTGLTCTLGVVTVRAGSDPGILTNHHCTRNRGMVDNDPFHQPVVSGNQNLIGQETIDTKMFRGPPCPGGRECRYSDASFISSAGVLELNRGYIARPTGVNDGSLTIDHNKPRFRIQAETLPQELWQVGKIGKETGWTRGSISLTCADTHVNGTKYTYLCQDWATFNATQGDSGSPVLLMHPTGTCDDCYLLGIMWGTSGANNSVFSYIGQVYLDLGPNNTWDTCAPEFGC